nr:acyl-CoA dehydrogenase family protein [Pseudonocardia acidicola]
MNDSAEAAEFRAEVRDFLAEVLPAGWQGVGALGETERAEWLPTWRSALLDRGLLVPSWPKEYGGSGRGLVEESILAEELARVGAPRFPLPTDPSGFVLIGPTILHWGTPEQKDFFLRRTVSGEIRWAQGYSEPEAGSDLFNVRTRAVLDGDEFVVNGQKIWQTAGIHANWIFAIVRTGTREERAKGLSFLLVDIDQPGVEVRGIRSMADDTELSEVYFTDARTPATNVVGEVGKGAMVALTLLGYERGAGGVAAALEARLELERLVELARSTGKHTDSAIRRRIAACWSTVHALRCLALRTLTTGAAGDPPGPESSITKLVMSEYRKRVTELALDVVGGAALTLTGAPSAASLGPQPRGADPLSSAGWVGDFLHARPGTVYGGSSEIQRNTIGEQVLRLPREPRVTIAPA